ncbi:thioredoxin family protein [Aureibaculum conchae]|uniref:thioredoxin family protein n=1 Tax=Aureibaculum sp. 2308TA14-22 TaxID=3108392 RepID=UPI003397A2E0
MLKLVTTIVFSIIFSIAIHTQSINQKSTDHNGREILLGKIDKSGLTENSFNTWFTPNYDAYKVDTKTLKLIKKELNNYTITAFMGTWCGDSKREVPKFYKILEAADYPMEQLTFIAVGNSKTNYKKSPTGEEKGLNIVRVPTFIFYKNGKEVNRIIEDPVVSFEKDIEAIITGKTYVPNYAEMKVK